MILASIMGSVMMQSAFAQPSTPPSTTPSGPNVDTLFQPIQGAPQSEIGTVANLANQTGYGKSTWQTILQRVIQMVLAVAGTLALISFTVAGVMLVTARGNEEQIGKGKHILIWSILALAVIAVSYAVVYGISLLNFSATQ